MNNSVNINTVNDDNCNVATKDHAEPCHSVLNKINFWKHSCDFCACTKFCKTLQKGSSAVVNRTAKNDGTG